ncbi:MAG: hypothetical protein KF696_12180 [Planctomycetes bacterium]|nr:hypothetical protein [Planctomycetota bacterium]MCW8136558.1 hypothetical protein [Planctomycetota bacterium]
MYTLRQIFTAIAAALVLAPVTGWLTFHVSSAIGVFEPYNYMLGWVVAVFASTVVLVKLYPRNEFDV